MGKHTILLYKTQKRASLELYILAGCVCVGGCDESGIIDEDRNAS